MYMYAHSEYMYQFGYRTLNFAVVIDMFKYVIVRVFPVDFAQAWSDRCIIIIGHNFTGR
jgi:hypothetical protein